MKKEDELKTLPDMIQVEAIREGFYGDLIRTKGSTFFVPLKDFDSSWFKATNPEYEQYNQYKLRE